MTEREEQIEATITAHVQAWIATGKRLVVFAHEREDCACALNTIPSGDPSRNHFISRGKSIGMTEKETWSFVSGFDGGTKKKSDLPEFYAMGDRIARRFGVRS